MTARPLGLATCPALDCPISQRFPRYTKVKFNKKENDRRSHWRFYTRSCCRSTFFMALIYRQKIITEKGSSKLNSLTKASKGFVHHFKDCNYECYEWLTARTEHKLFCWPFTFWQSFWNDRPMDFIYKWQVSALLFDEYCIKHIVMEVYMVRW